MKTPGSNYISINKPLFKKLQKMLAERFGYVSVLVSDCKQRRYRVSAQGMSSSEENTYGRRGYVLRVYDGNAYAEYAASEINEEIIPHIIEKIEYDLCNLGNKFDRFATKCEDEDELTFSKSTEYEVFPEDLGDEKILAELTDIRTAALSTDERIMDSAVTLEYQMYSKLFLSNKKDLEQNVLHTCGSLLVMAARGEEIKSAYKGFSVLGGAELLETMKNAVSEKVKTTLDLLDSEPLEPGTYECICTPEVTGMVVHEAFGHGVEMDMFVKDRALAKNCIGEMLASELVTMRDGAACAREVASFFFDDEGNIATDTIVIDHGKLVGGFADGLSAARLGIKPTGNGRRESVERKAYTRMTNTFFEGGKDSIEDMIASVKYGLLLEDPTSGMEDPKNWGIQCMVNSGREIKDGRLTGRIFSPIVLSGYVPDLLKSISMMSPNTELCGSGACGKGYKEWVKVSDGGPWIKAQIRLG